jgi:hypothetical protein
MPSSLRSLLEAQYSAWLAERLAVGLPPLHNTTAATTPFIAWIESIGLFGERFFAFAKRIDPPRSGVSLRQAFFRNELSSDPLLVGVGLEGYVQACRRAGTQLDAAITGTMSRGRCSGPSSSTCRDASD